MTTSELAGVAWRTSRHSVGDGACVEVALAPAGVLVRDSKDRQGPTLAFRAATWRAFLTTVTH